MLEAGWFYVLIKLHCLHLINVDSNMANYIGATYFLELVFFYTHEALHAIKLLKKFHFFKLFIHK